MSKASARKPRNGGSGVVYHPIPGTGLVFSVCFSTLCCSLCEDYLREVASLCNLLGCSFKHGRSARFSDFCRSTPRQWKPRSENIVSDNQHSLHIKLFTRPETTHGMIYETQ